MGCAAWGDAGGGTYGVVHLRAGLAGVGRLVGLKMRINCFRQVLIKARFLCGRETSARLTFRLLHGRAGAPARGVEVVARDAGGADGEVGGHL